MLSGSQKRGKHNLFGLMLCIVRAMARLSSSLPTRTAENSRGTKFDCSKVANGGVMSSSPRSVLVRLALAGLAVAMSHPVDAAGDAKRGKQIAEKWCAKCHKIAPGALRFDNTRPASFQEIADTPGMGELALKVFFQTPHRQMPNFSITGDVRDDLIAYITGLKRK